MTEPVLIEVCVDSVASAAAAERGGAHRIELCSDLLEGGITPSVGLLQAVRAGISLPLHVIIRPRGGDFCYSGEEFVVMWRDLEIAKRAGAEGVVLGMLLPSGRVDIARTRQLTQLAAPMSVTFHRAFDMSADLQNSLEEVCQTGANRLLTSGGEQDCLQGTEAIAKLVQSARGRIHIMAGGGVNAGNVAHILKRTGVTEIHVGLATAMPSPMLVRNSRVSLGKVPGREYHRSQVLEESVRELKRAIAEVPAVERSLKK
jgi:copper homeostasis protein